MADTQQQLLLYEALELRAEYDARLKTLKDCLPEGQQPRERFAFAHADESQTGPRACTIILSALTTSSQVRWWKDLIHVSCTASRDEADFF